MTEVGPIVASGRDGDIYEYGPGLVLRRTKRPRVIEHEARVMAYAAEHGYPVPKVHDVLAGGTEIVMERLEGPMMMDQMTKQPRTFMANTRLLADLHDQLHEIPAPDWLPTVRRDDETNRLIHLDLHPMNVMITARGPVVIDWTNAAQGAPLTDVGLTYVLLTCAQGPMSFLMRNLLRPARAVMARVFSQRFRGPAFDEHVAYAAELKMLDPAMLPGEIESFRRLADRMRANPGPAGN